MKHRIAIVIVLVMLVSSILPAYAQTVDGRGLFTLEIPEDWEDYGYSEESDVEGDSYDLGFYVGYGVRDLNIAVSLYAYPEYADVRLFELDDDSIHEYGTLMMDEFFGTEIVTECRVGDYEIPFVVFYSAEDKGQAIVAVTMSNGWAILFMGYAYEDADYAKMRDLNEDDVELFLDILNTFEPTVKGSAQ